MTIIETHHYDVIVVGGGNAGLVAALSAQEHGARVAVIDSAPKEERGGNSRFAGAIFRIVHKGLDELKPLLCEESATNDVPRVRVGPYTREKYEADMLKTTKGLCNREQMEVVFEKGYETVMWMKEKGVEWQLTLKKFFNEDAIKGKVFDMIPGGALMAKGEGEGLTDNLWAAVEKCMEPKIDVFYGTPAIDLIMDGDTCLGVTARLKTGFAEFRGKVILACGGFEASSRLRRQWLGEGWDLVVVRGTRFNTGTMIEKGIAAGCGNTGHWGGCHASPQDLGAPKVGDLSVSDHMSRYSYPYSISVNLEGKRFFNEGENTFGYTYAKTGAAIGRQTDATAFQIFDQRTLDILEPRYKTARSIFKADTIQELGEKIGVDAVQFVKTVEEYNAACPPLPEKIDPFVTDGHSTGTKLAIPKTNWAYPIDQGPFVAYGVTCGKH
jgi:tricarballylate dehydrogenase